MLARVPNTLIARETEAKQAMAPGFTPKTAHRSSVASANEATGLQASTRAKSRHYHQCLFRYISVAKHFKVVKGIKTPFYSKLVVV